MDAAVAAAAKRNAKRKAASPASAFGVATPLQPVANVIAQLVRTAALDGRSTGLVSSRV